MNIATQLSLDSFLSYGTLFPETKLFWLLGQTGMEGQRSALAVCVLSGAIWMYLPLPHTSQRHEITTET